MNELRDEHYLRAVTELGDTHKIVANQDIYSKSGLKLVASGVAISSNLYERLVNHVLLKPLDMSVSSEDMVDAETLWSDAKILILENSKLGKMVEMIDKGFPLRKGILSIKLPSPLAFKLMVAREKYPDLYQHSLSIMIMSVYLARCDGMDLNEEGYVATAALFHDIGLMHIDPGLLDSNHLMSVDERRHLYAHPLTAYLLLLEFPELPRYIAEAVLDHHERMDGRGYPRGLRDKKISRYGQILAVAEVSAKTLEPGSPVKQWQKLELMLKLNSKQYGNGLIGFISSLRDADVDDDEKVKQSDPGELAAQVVLIVKLFEDFYQNSDVDENNEIYNFAQIRLAGLKLDLLAAGFDSGNPEELIQHFADDPECMSEYGMLLKEIIWQFNSLTLDISRNWPDVELTKKKENAWLGNMKLLLMAA